MFFSDVEFFILIFFIITASLSLNNLNFLSMLLTAEVLWILLYSLVLKISFLIDSISLLSLSFFFLIFSSVEFAFGITLLIGSFLFKRSIILDANNPQSSSLFFSKNFSNYINSYKWLF